MASADDPKTQVQTSPTSSPTSVTSPADDAAPPAPVPAKKPRMSPEDFNNITNRLDTILVALVLIFAFLTACFAVRNSDFFQYLATGRLLAHGQYAFGKDPFSFATDDVHWVNHSWLYSFFLYLIYSIGDVGGIVLIVLKSLAITALAGVLLAVSRKPGERWLIPASCTAVAMLALSSRLYFQPVIVSYLFLGLTLLLLRWPHLQPSPKAKGPQSFRCFWLLPPLFALWVNCDQWFFLGPTVAGLYWLGEYLQDSLATDRTHTRPTDELRILGYAVLAGFAACLLNPHHIFAFTLPPQLGLGTTTAVSRDNQLQSLFISPLDKIYWTPFLGISAAGIAYFPLLVAGIASFALTYKSLRYWRVFLFTAFGLLSLYHARAIPFFAVIAGPITSLNFLDFAAERLGGEVEPDRLRMHWTLGRVVAILAAVALVVCSIPGWTQAQPYASRRIGWQIVPDESLKRTCEKMAQWRADGLLEPDAHWFNISPEVLSYMAWYCPGERGFLDLRLALYDDKAATDYVNVRADLLGLTEPTPTPGQPQGPKEEWREVFDRRHVDYLIIYSSSPSSLYGPDLAKRRKPLERLFFDPVNWTPLSLDGHTLVFARNKKDKDAQARVERLKFDLTPEAFGANAVQAPRTRPSLPAIKSEWYTALWQAPLSRQQAVDDADIYRIYSTLLQNRWTTEKVRNYQKLVMLSGSGAGMAPVWALQKIPFYIETYVLSQEPLPPAALYVGLRGLRRSLHANPDDPQAYIQLGQLYSQLFWDTEYGRTTAAGLAQVAQIRQTQITWALYKALELNPDLEEPHMLLAIWYRNCRERNVPCYLAGEIRRPFLDTELKHLKELLRIARQKFGDAKTTVTGNAPGEGESSGIDLRNPEGRIKGLEEDVQKLESLVKKQLDKYEIQSAGKPVLQRAMTALDLGLADEALTLLRNAAPEDLIVKQGSQSDPVGAIVVMKLLLALGQVDEARAYLEPTRKTNWGRSLEFRVLNFDWFSLLMAAASGDYDDADDALLSMSEFALKDNDVRFSLLQRFDVVNQPSGRPFTVSSREAVALAFGQILLNEATTAAGMPPQLYRRLQSTLQMEPYTRSLTDLTMSVLSLDADYPTLRGWMALEAGDTKAARKYYREALVAAVPHDRNLALYAAAGAMASVKPARVGDGPLLVHGPVLNLRSRPLAAMGLFFLNGAEPTAR